MHLFANYTGKAVILPHDKRIPDRLWYPPISSARPGSLAHLDFSASNVPATTRLQAPFCCNCRRKSLHKSCHLRRGSGYTSRFTAALEMAFARVKRHWLVPAQSARWSRPTHRPKTQCLDPVHHRLYSAVALTATSGFSYCIVLQNVESRSVRHKRAPWQYTDGAQFELYINAILVQPEKSDTSSFLPPPRKTPEGRHPVEAQSSKGGRSLHPRSLPTLTPRGVACCTREYGPFYLVPGASVHVCCFRAAAWLVGSWVPVARREWAGCVRPAVPRGDRAPG